MESSRVSVESVVRKVFSDIKFEHSIFALPFAYLGMVLAARGLPSLAQIAWITVAMVAARTLAMTANRAIDRQIDARNPRTKARALPSGRISTPQMIVASIVSLAIFLLAAAMLNPLTLALAPLAAVIVVGYSYTKRFTPFSHLALGLSDAIAPMGGWLAVRPELDLLPFLLALAVGLWIAGFDVIYALQDVEFDRANGLKSIPATYGVAPSLWTVRAFHIITSALLLFVGVLAGLGAIYYVGWAVASLLLLYENRLVKPDDLSKLGVAFFNVNGYISVIVFVFTLLGIYIR